jgi:CPA2 family monovalent cation:H+ antiporter-2
VADTHYLGSVLILLSAAVICVPLFQRLRLGPVLGYLVAGALIGPSGFGLVSHIDVLRSLAELGVVFLLFTIGLELTLEKLRSLGAKTFLLGVCQIVTAAMVSGAAVYGLGFSGAVALLVGGALALSSTAIVVPLLAGQGRLATDFGQTVLPVLLVQDLAVAPLLVLLDALRGNMDASSTELVMALGLSLVKAVVAVGLIVAVGRFALQPLFRMVANAKSPELFVGSALLVAMGTSFATEQAGLSLAFGAFLAGLLLAETEFRHQIAADIEPFRGLLLGLFFMTIGMSIDSATAVDHAGALAATTVAILAGKTLLLAPLARMFGYDSWTSMRLGLMLSQGGEFGFVVFTLAGTAGLLPRPWCRC